ncbi:MAG: abortive infection family protein [Anaerostipes hadrus]
MIEEVLIFILESNKVPVESKGDLNRIYNQVKGLYNMRQDKGYDGRVNSLLGGLEKIVQSVAEMRNINSDSHGVGRNRIAIKESEARLVMNSAVTFSEYILDIYKNHK